MSAFCMSSRSASQRDSGHCSGYHAVPNRMAGGCEAVDWLFRASGENKQTTMSTATQMAHHRRVLIILPPQTADVNAKTADIAILGLVKRLTSYIANALPRSSERRKLRKRRLDICVAKILALEEQRLIHCFCERIGETIAKV